MFVGPVVATDNVTRQPGALSVNSGSAPSDDQSVAPALSPTLSAYSALGLPLFTRRLTLRCRAPDEWAGSPIPFTPSGEPA